MNENMNVNYEETEANGTATEQTPAPKEGFLDGLDNTGKVVVGLALIGGAAVAKAGVKTMKWGVKQVKKAAPKVKGLFKKKDPKAPVDVEYTEVPDEESKDE